MSCCRCGEDAECFVVTMAGTLLFCRSCSEDWWAITLQPPSDEFWSIEREQTIVADAFAGDGEILRDGVREAPGYA